MPDNQPSLTTLEIAVAKVRSDITVIENTIEALKTTDDRIEASTSKATEDIVALRLEVSAKFNTMNSDISILQSDVHSVKEDVKDTNDCVKNIQKNVTDNKVCLTRIDDKLDAISGQSPLDFSSVNAKKVGIWVTAVVTIISAIFAGISSLQPSSVQQTVTEEEAAAEEVILRILEKQEAILDRIEKDLPAR